MDSSTDSTKKFLVRRTVVMDHRVRGSEAEVYQRVETPNSGELIYHGEFIRKELKRDHGPNGMIVEEYFVALDESQVTSEKYFGDEVVTF